MSKRGWVELGHATANGLSRVRMAEKSGDCRTGNLTVSHTQIEFPTRMIFKTAATTLALCLVFQVQADTLLGKVISVADGDTITILDDTQTQHKIRLTGIDAPEKKQPFGQRSKQSLSDLVFAKTVTVETNKVDKYKRNVGKVLVDGLDANLVQVQRGFAWHYKAYEREQSTIDRKAYAVAESEARAARRGLWADSEPVPPWEFRHNK